ncbi:plasmepsin VII, putative [Plasmodium chabaudi adami]|uniref:Plasmepsin VII, putative n=1 Tax=Plasmodium chabaudi adami TaxID=5826 RepID=A0A1D3LHL4_PLACE|nr:plasmepsin VII, putative [Plasmodium chabaudi adami]
MKNVYYYFSIIFFLKLFLCNCILAIPQKTIGKGSLSLALNELKNNVDNNSLNILGELKNSKPFINKSFIQTNEKKDNVLLLKLYKQNIASDKLSTYYGKIAIGENSENIFNVLFDTGSTEFWVPFKTCKFTKNNTHNKYERTKSFKYKYDNKGLPSVLEINYLSGKLVGFDGYDTVYLGPGFAIPHTNIAFATSIDIPVLEKFKWDGIIGLGFENEDSQKRGIKPFLDHLKDEKILTEKNYKNMFGYYITNTGGYITLGGIDDRFKRSPDEKIIWSPVSTEMGFWTIDILGIRKEEQPYMNERRDDEVIVKYEGFHDGSNKSIVDTGTFLIYAPKKTMENYLNDLTINSCEDKHKLPYIIFQIKSKEIESIKGLSVIELVLSPNDYVIEYIDEVKSTKECIIGIQSDEDNINGWTLGQVFLKSYYTIFDKDNLQIGFVRNKQKLNDETYLNESFLRVNKKRNKKMSYNGPLKL